MVTYPTDKHYISPCESCDSLRAEVERLRKVIDDLPMWAFGWGDKIAWEIELRRRAGEGEGTEVK